MNNPLMSGPRRPAGPPAPDPMLRHAQIWRHVESQPPESLQKHVAMMDYGLPMLGKLAGDPDVTAKDVIKVISRAVADGHMDASTAVAGISQMPADPDKLRPYLKERYADALAATVHAKAALMRQAQPVAQPAQPIAQPQGQPMPQGAPPGTVP